MSRTLFVGHSLVGQVMPTMFNTFMTSQNIDVTADAQVINGAPLRYNWDNGAAAEGVNARDVLSTGDYDTVIVTEAIPLDDQLRWNDTHGYAERYYDAAQSANPGTQFYVYETWHAIGASTQDWRAQITEDLPKWQGIVDHVNASAVVGTPDAQVIPAGQAMGALHDRIEAGEVPGISSIRDLFDDEIHLNDTGNWFIAALQASAVTGVDVSLLPLETFHDYSSYDGPDAALADVFADVIDTTLNDFLPEAPMRPADETDTSLPYAQNDEETDEGVGSPADQSPQPEAVPPSASADQNGLTFTLDGADMHHFVVDPATGDISNQSWFTPDYDQIWDINGDRTYEVERVGSNTNGEEVSRSFFELETTRDGTVWRELGGETEAADTTQSIAQEASFFLDGPDAYHFVINPENGEIDNIDWFEPSFDQIWDTNGDRIYEVERFALAEDGSEIWREALEMETTPDGVVWRAISTSENGDMSGAQIISALALPPATDDDLPDETEEPDAELAIAI